MTDNIVEWLPRMNITLSYRPAGCRRGQRIRVDKERIGIKPKTSCSGRILKILLGIYVTNNILDRYKEKERGLVPTSQLAFTFTFTLPCFCCFVISSDRPQKANSLVFSWPHPPSSPLTIILPALLLPQFTFLFFNLLGG